MFQLRFNQVFTALLLLSAISALFVPQRFTSPLRALFQNIFAPVSYPVRAVASGIASRVSDQHPVDDGADDPAHPRSADQLIQENTDLRMSVASLSKQLMDLQQRDAERRQVGPVLELCRPFAVTGTDPGTRRGLLIRGTTLAGVRQGMPALYPGGIAGRIGRAGVGGSTVELVTDSAFACTVGFARFSKNEQGQLVFVNLKTPPALMRGTGRDGMSINSINRKDVESAGIEVGDWVILDDPDWPVPVQGYRIGKVVARHNRLDAPLFVDLQVQPVGDLLTLREVMVMVKDQY